jgi:adenosylhomocysteine nucleosidase
MRYDLVFFAALDREVSDLTRGLQRVVADGPFALWAGRIGSSDALLVRTGIGPRAAHAAATRVFARVGAGAALSIGTCGGLVDDLGAAELVVASDVVDAVSGDAFPADPGLAALIREAVAGGRHRVARIASAPEILSSAEAKRALAERTGAAAVDMESAAIAREAASAGVPFGAVRAVLDLAAEALPAHPDGPIVDDAGKPHWSRLLALAARDPTLPMGLAKLWRRERAARAAVGLFVRALCRPPVRAAS